MDPDTYVDDFKIKKKFGQNFLVNKDYQDRVIEIMGKVVNQFPDRSILEVGPGKGDLTQFYFDFDRQVYAMEIDKEAVDHLQNRFEPQDKFTLLETDALKNLRPDFLTEKKIPQDFVLLANLPFNVGSRILVDLGVYFPNTPMAIVLQKEVVEKLTKTHNFTFFSAFLSLFWDFKVGVVLPRHVFSPQPKVKSALVVGKPKNYEIEKMSYTHQSFYDRLIQSETFRLKVRDTLKKLFSFPNKTLVNNLKQLGWSSDNINKFLDSANIDTKTRLERDNYTEILIAVLNM